MPIATATNILAVIYRITARYSPSLIKKISVTKTIERIKIQCGKLATGVIESMRTQNANQKAHNNSTTSTASVMILFTGLGKESKYVSIVLNRVDYQSITL